MFRPVRPMNRKILRYASWFLEAGWAPAEVAELFDVSVASLRKAMEATL